MEQREIKEFIDDKVREIKEAVGSHKAIVALSGGVDSSTCALLAHRAIGNMLKAIFIEDGLMREGEAKRVLKTFSNLGIKVEVIEAQDEFFETLKGKFDPEEKRKAFRDIFYRVLGREVKRSGASHLIQGTIKADIIETERGVKTQHNILEQIGIDPERYGFSVVEPLKDLFKHEVREVARELGLPREVYQRMPFPGPGLAARIIGEVTPDRVDLVRRATKIVEDVLGPLSPFQAFAVLLNDLGTGIVEGKRRLGKIIIIRSVESKDAMTAEPTCVPWEMLLYLSKRITTEIPEVVRVAFEITSKPPSTIEYV